jgi:AcrR family transcriptional regulator
MVSSAIYRYFPSRDELLTALIVDAFDAVGAAAEVSEERGAPFQRRWLALAGAVRSWAIANPHEWALIYGSPVPGYNAPTDTVDPAARVSLVFLRLLADGVGAGEVADGDAIETSRTVRSDLRRLRDLAAPDVPDEVLSRGLLAWTQLFGAISYELFGHLEGVITDFEGFFDLQARRAAELLLLP